MFLPVYSIQSHCLVTNHNTINDLSLVVLNYLDIWAQERRSADYMKGSIGLLEISSVFMGACNLWHSCILVPELACEDKSTSFSLNNVQSAELLPLMFFDLPLELSAKISSPPENYSNRRTAFPNVRFREEQLSPVSLCFIQPCQLHPTLPTPN